MGEPGQTIVGHIAAVDRGSLANHGARVSVGRFEQLNITISCTKTRGSLHFNTQIYISWYFRSFWADFSQTNFTSSRIRVHYMYMKSDNQFPSISQNN